VGNTFEFHRRRVGRLYRDYGDFFTVQDTLLNCQRWRRQDISVGFHICQLPK
jgi:hypothetical protein